MANEKLGVATELFTRKSMWGFTFMQWSLTFWNLKKHHFVIVRHISIWWAWSFVSEVLSPPKTPPRGDGPVWQNFSLLFNVIDSEKYLGYTICQTCKRTLSNFLFISMSGPKVALHIQIVSILLHEATPVLGLFYLHLNTIGWSGDVTSTIRRDNWSEFKVYG